MNLRLLLKLASLKNEMETILAFVLIVTMDERVVGNRVFYENKDSLTEAKCLPQFVPQKTKFWD